MNRILVIRGGAIGDFILTLPAIRALREACPRAHLEILGYKHIAALAQDRFYANAVRSIEYGPLASLFTKDGEPSAEITSYFAAFDLVVSYLYDPEDIFENNLCRCEVRKLVRGPAKIGPDLHATRQLAQPIESVGIPVHYLTPKLFPSDTDRDWAGEVLTDLAPPVVAFHPGSGGKQKNWPSRNWIQLGNHFLENCAGSLVIVSGEADENQVRPLEAAWKDGRVRFTRDLPLPTLAAMLEEKVFVGHDTGISHLAAAAGAECILLFGPTDPVVWAPLNENACVIRGTEGQIDNISVGEVEAAISAKL